MKIDMRNRDDVLLGIWCRVYLDGEPVLYALAADEERGVVRVIEKNISDEPVRDQGGNYITQAQFGNVEIRLLDTASGTARQLYELRRAEEDTTTRPRPKRVLPMASGDPMLEQELFSEDRLMRRALAEEFRLSRQRERMRIRDEREIERVNRYG